ncbi:MAG: hypothetical protein ACJAXB_001332 [Candidatus Endobugula sp.]|jgi:hypothetical protein
MKKMKYWMIVVVMFFSTISFAQDSTYLSNEYAKARAIYNQAQLYNDVEVQKNALYDMIVLSPYDSSVMRSLKVHIERISGHGFFEEIPRQYISLRGCRFELRAVETV